MASKVAGLAAAIALSLLGFSAPVHAQTPLSWDGSDPLPSGTRQNATVIPNTYIVQLKAGSSNPGRRSFEPHAEFERRSLEAEIDYTTRQKFADPSLFLGLSLTLNGNTEDLQALKDLDNVVNVFPVYSIPRPAAAISMVNIRKSDIKRRAVAPGTNVSIPYIVGDIEVNNPLAMAKVDQAHALGIKGKGMKIAIIDTGVDLRHPSLGGCFGEGCKIAFGYDFITPKADPGVTCLGGGHGTHVSGIIGMEDPAGQGFGLVGVAPEATLGMYRVFDCSGTAATDVILSAMLRAASDGADVVSMSLGADLASEASDPFKNVTTALADQGIAVIAANGNDGDYGVYNPSAPGIGPGVFAVGSTDNSKFPTTYKLKDSNGRTLRYSSVLPIDAPADGLIVQVINYNYASTADTQGCYTVQYPDALANLTAQGIDPSKVILLVENGGCNNVLKGREAKKSGYNYVLVYTKEDQTPPLQVYEDVYPGLNYNITPVQTSVQDSKTILGSYGKHPFGYKLYFDSSDYDAQSPPVASGGLMSNYSSFGPLYDLTLKPQLSAPGGQILSTWPLDINSGYAVISGTSMATPFMAGAYALIKSQKPELSVKEIYALMQNSGRQLPWVFDSSVLSTAVHQGAGALDVMRALTWESLVMPAQLNLGFSNTTVTRNFTITNRSTRSKTYTFSHSPAAGMQYPTQVAWQRDYQYAWYANATFQPESVLIKAGESATITAFVTPPPKSTWNSKFWPIYTGYLIAHNNYETYSVPYVGSPFVNPYA